MNAQTVTTATKNSYPAKEALKAAGFVFQGGQWINYNFDVEKWNLTYANPTWAGRGKAKVNAAVVFETITIAI